MATEWNSIDEGSAEEPIVLRGIPAAAGSDRRARRWITFGGIAAFFNHTISWSIAVTVHLILGIVMMSYYFDRDVPDRSILWAELYKGNAGEEGKEVEAPEFEPIEEKEEAKPEPEKVSEPEKKKTKIVPEPAVVKEPLPEVSPPAPNPVEAPPVKEPRPAVIGGGASTAGSSAAAAVSDSEVETDPTAAIRRRRAGDLQGLRRGSPGHIYVVAGMYDQVQKVLDKLKVKYTLTDLDSLPRFDISKAKALLINCHNLYATDAVAGVASDVRSILLELAEVEERQEEVRNQLREASSQRRVARLNVDLLRIGSRIVLLRRRLGAAGRTARLVDKIREFVKGGGYVFTSDWGLTLIERAFPKTIMIGSHVGPVTVDIQIPKSSLDNPLLHEVFYGSEGGSTRTLRKFRWRVDGSSYSIRILNEKVRPLVVSPKLGSMPSVAVVFPVGDRKKPGKVLHVLSHFENQATKQGDYALQTLLINFLLDRIQGGLKVPPRSSQISVRPIRPKPLPMERTFADAKGRFSLPVPKGWTAKATDSPDVPLVLSNGDGKGSRATLTISTSPFYLTRRNPDWNAYLRMIDGVLQHRVDELRITRRIQAMCSGHQALMVGRRYVEKGMARGSVDFIVATPKALYTLSWSTAEDGFEALEPTFEKASRGLMLLE